MWKISSINNHKSSTVTIKFEQATFPFLEFYNFSLLKIGHLNYNGIENTKNYIVYVLHR